MRAWRCAPVGARRPCPVSALRGRPSAGVLAAECGSAAVWVVVACLVTWSLATIAVSVGGAVVARHRAASAADLAALAGARSLASGAGDPCAEAERVAAATRARLVACERLADGSLQVVAEAALPPLLARWAHLPPARARARAGVGRALVGRSVALDRRRGHQEAIASRVTAHLPVARPAVGQGLLVGVVLVS